MRNRFIVIGLMIGSLGLLMGADATCFARGTADAPTVIVTN